MNSRLGLVAALVVACIGFPQLVRAQYIESFQTWSATSADTWQTKDLSGAPFNVPGRAVVEVAIRNASISLPRFGGVRAVGSSLERRIDLHEAVGGGVDVLVMQVQTDASSQIQHYADDTSDVDFVLLGYWECGAYVERFDIFNASLSWQDKDLNTYGVGAGDVAEIVMTNEANAQAYDAGVRANGSVLERRVVLQATADGVDSISMFVQADNSGSATIEAYAGHVSKVSFYLVGYWNAAPGSYTETFTDIGSPTADATWEDIDLTASGAADGAVAEILFANDITLEENELGVRTNGSSVARLFDLRQENAGTGDGDFGRMHAESDASAIIEFRHEDVSDAHTFYMLGYWQGGAVLSDHDAGQETDAFKERGAETNAELFAFELTPCAGTVTVTEVVFRLTDIVGLTNGDWAGIELLVDDNDNGAIDTGETTTVGGAGVVDTAAGTITFSTSFDSSASTHYILRADFASLSLADKVTIGLDGSDISATSLITGSATSVTHLEQCYVEVYQTWTASSADTWQTQDLSGAPYNVPANAVVEVAIRNDSITAELWGGVRAVGSGLERRRLLQEAEGGGYDLLVMHVQTNASSEIQHYSDVTSNVDFVLLGYWDCGTYVEAFDTFTAGASASWQDRDLCSYGVRPGHVAEIVMTNDNAIAEREAGVRTNGSGLQRTVTLHEAEDGGVDTSTMFVEADTTLNATIELYAQVDADVDFYLVGYWSIAPLAFNELSVDIGSPTGDATWEDIDLTSDGVADAAVAEFVLANDFALSANNIGVRENGSSLGRLLDTHEAEDGGSDLGRMHVQADTTATIEFYHEVVSDAHTFQLVGYWDACDTSIEYVASDLGAVTAANSSLGWHINSSEKVAGFEEDASGDPDAWYLSCGSFTSLGVLGGSDAEAHGINENDMVVGWSDDGSGNRRAYTWTSGGGMTNLGTVSGRSDSNALSVNGNSEVVGTVVDFSSPPRNRLAFIYLPSPAYTLSAGMTSLGTLGGPESVGMDINDSGQVVGGAQNGSGYYRPCRWQSGIMTDLGTLGGDSPNPNHRGEAISAMGDVVGHSYTAGGAGRAFFWDGGMTDLDVLSGGTDSWAFGLNDSSVVVGTSDVTGGVFRAFVWDSANGMRNLNNLIPTGTGWTLIRATDINNDGFITGFGTNGSGDGRAFLLTPTCNAGGGGAAAAVFLAGGAGFTDGDGVFVKSLIDSEGAPLAYIELLNPESDIRIEYELFDPEPVSDGTEPADTRMREGFADGIALTRTFEITTTAIQEGSSLTVSMTFALDEIAELDVDPDDLELHALDPAAGGSPGVWVPAGKSVGESLPTTVVGESGFVVYADGSVDYWAVRTAGGTFAVGKPMRTHEVSTPSGSGTRFCGIAVIQPLLFCSTVLLFSRWSRRRSRSFLS